MITERELRQIAARNAIGAGQAEHEYAQLCVLDTLAQVSPLADAFCFKGGTALRLVYFADWRRSVDLDFSVLPLFTLRKRHNQDSVDWEQHPVAFFRLTEWAWDEKRVEFEER